MNPYRLRVWQLLQGQFRSGQSFSSVLDFGCGDGWFARQFLDSGLAKSVEAIDVKQRDHTFVVPTIYPGGPLPYSDGQFDLAYSVDVLHHCDDPEAQLLEMARCSRGLLLIKDHTYDTAAGKWALAVLDELGNRKFGIPSPYRYQKGWDWHHLLETKGWQRIGHAYPAPVHVSVLGMLTNPLQFVSLYRRREAKDGS